VNAQDLARLELAKRAYQAAQPSSREIQTGVRRTRLWLQRPKARRNWFSKGLVMVVLAVGSLAYARPQALSELVTNMLPVVPTAHEKSSHGSSLAAASEPKLEQEPKAPAAAAALPVAAALGHGSAPAHAALGHGSAPAHAALGDGSAPADAAQLALLSAPSNKGVARGAAPSPNGPSRVARGASSPRAGLEAASAGSEPETEWGRVGRALARGDETSALSALTELSQSDNQLTRDKADLGRAQLLMAGGNADEACAIARSLTHRRAGSRIERQALLLLKSCQR
jgi:hypothetical protein